MFMQTIALAAKISGYVSNEEREALPFATLYVKEIDYGTTSNLEGYYEIELKNGTYTVIVQFLGYETQEIILTVNNVNIRKDIYLKTQSLLLPNLTYKVGKEDPAYAIMRRVIAKSKYHLYQCKSYTTEVYVKGSGRLVNVPFFLRNRLRKEGIDSSRVFMVESLSSIEYEMPNIYRQKVISIKSTMEENAPDPMPFIKTSFYQPRLPGALSPISPVAFNHYRFRYEGSFKDKGVVVNKIYVEPKIKGDIVFEGFLNIIEDLWAIHSLDFNTLYQGFNVNIKQIYHPIEPEVWMPVTHRFNVDGSFLGFKLEFKYVAVNNGYQVELNDQFIDSLGSNLKISESNQSNAKTDEILDLDLKPERELTKKDMRKIMRNYEKQALQESGQNDKVLFNEEITIDSTAYKKDSFFWSEIRPIPLSAIEVKNYELKDSLFLEQLEDRRKDSIRNEKNKKFRLHHIIVGNDYKLSEKIDLSWQPLWNKISFNSVEGWNLHTGIDLGYNIDSARKLSFGPTIRYGFSSKRWYGSMYMKYNFLKFMHTGEVFISGGKYIYQINRNNPIPFWLNMAGSLFFHENFMKLFERKFLDFFWKQPLSSDFLFTLNASWEDKSPLENTTEFSFFEQEKEYGPNNPENILIGETIFNPYQQLFFNLNMTYLPFIRFIERNGVRSVVPGSSPEFNLGYSIALSPGTEKILSYHRLNTGIRYTHNFGVGNRLDLYFAGSKIFANSSLAFPEFTHFNGNRTPLISGDMYSSFRMLDYYFYNTNDYHIETHLFYQFRKLLITQIIYARMAGIREDLIIKYLYSNTLKNYIELGYALENLFNIFRLELVGQFDNFDYRGLGFRIGFSKNISLE